jgi:hypothetical protein
MTRPTNPPDTVRPEQPAATSTATPSWIFPVDAYGTIGELVDLVYDTGLTVI